MRRSIRVTPHSRNSHLTSFHSFHAWIGMATLSSITSKCNDSLLK